jgi:hypothetical protein
VFMKGLLHHATGWSGNWQLVEALKEGFCSAAGDYQEQLRAAADQPRAAGMLAGRMCIWRGVVTLRCS